MLAVSSVGIAYVIILGGVLVVALYFARRAVSNKASGGNAPWNGKDEQ